MIGLHKWILKNGKKFEQLVIFNKYTFFCINFILLKISLYKRIFLILVISNIEKSNK